MSSAIDHYSSLEHTLSTDKPATLEMQLYDMHAPYESGLTPGAEEIVIGALTLLSESVFRVSSPEKRKASGSAAKSSTSSSSSWSNAGSREERTLMRALSTAFVSSALEHMRHMGLSDVHSLASDFNLPNKLQMCALNWNTFKLCVCLSCHAFYLRIYRSEAKLSTHTR